MVKHFEIFLIICIFAVICLFVYQIGNKIWPLIGNERKELLKVDFLPIETKENVSGFIDAKGDFYPFNIGGFYPGPVINGFCVIDHTLCKVSNNPMDTIPILNFIGYYGIMNDGLMPICKINDYITLVDTEGVEAFQLKMYDNKEVLGCFGYSDSKLRVILEDSLYVYVDKEGQKLFNSSFSWATDFKNGHAVIQREDQNDELFSLIDNNGTSIFSFESEDKDYIMVSSDIGLLSAKENGKIVIYDFTGERIFKCPSDVRNIYALYQDNFIYYNKNGKMGLMTYKGENLIIPIYNKLVQNGDDYIVCTEDSIIRLANKKGAILKDFGKGGVVDYQHAGYDFPNVLITQNGVIIIGSNGAILAEASDDPDILCQDEIDDMAYIRNDYFPHDEILNTIMELCGDGNDVSNRYGAFLNRPNTYCTPNDITFLSSYSINYLIGRHSVSKQIGLGINYQINYEVFFDDSIVLNGKNEINPSASVVDVLLSLNLYKWKGEIFIKDCVDKLLRRNCEVLEASGNNYLVLHNELLYLIKYQGFDEKDETDIEKEKSVIRIFITKDDAKNRETYSSFLE